MKVLDLDMDYFLDYPVNNIGFSSIGRVTDEACIASVWSEERVRNFLENNVGLSKTQKIPGRILSGHDEALYFWDELIETSKLEIPFSVVHVDSHADLNFGGLGIIAILNEIVYWPLEWRKPRNCHNIQIDGKFYDIDIGNYLLYALAFRWISDLDYCGNPNSDCGDIPQKIVIGDIPDCEFKTAISRAIKLEGCNPTEEACTDEPRIPFRIFPNVEKVKYKGDFDFVSLAQSPNYTPEKADFIMDVFREYIVEI